MRARKPPKAEDALLRCVVTEITHVSLNWYAVAVGMSMPGEPRIGETWQAVIDVFPLHEPRREPRRSSLCLYSLSYRNG